MTARSRSLSHKGVQAILNTMLNYPLSTSNLPLFNGSSKQLTPAIGLPMVRLRISIPLAQVFEFLAIIHWSVMAMLLPTTFPG